MSNVRVLDTPLPSHELLLDSEHCTSSDSTGSRCVWSLPNQLTHPTNMIMYATVTSASIPVSFFNIPVGSQLELSQEGYAKLLQLLPGNYSLIQMLTHIDELLRDCGWNYTDADAVTHTRPLLDWSPRTNKITITHTAPLTLGSRTTINKQLGFSSGPHTSTTNTLVSNSGCDVRGNHLLYIMSNYVSNTSSTLLSAQRAIAHIPITVGVYATQSYQNESGCSHIVPNHTKVIELSICSASGSLVSVNKMLWAVTLRIDYMYVAALKLPPRLNAAHLAWSHSYMLAVQKKQAAIRKAAEIARGEQLARQQKINTLVNFLEQQ
jgi:hypothetical protein